LEEDDDIEFVEIDILIDDEDWSTKLPPHKRCAAHTQNLVLKDAKKVEDSVLLSVRDAVFDKLHKFWKYQSRGNSEIYEKINGKLFPIPIDVRWHTYIDSVEAILKSGISKVNEIVTAVQTHAKEFKRKINIDSFSAEDFYFLEEYFKVCPHYSYNI